MSGIFCLKHQIFVFEKCSFKIKTKNLYQFLKFQSYFLKLKRKFVDLIEANNFLFLRFFVFHKLWLKY